MTVICHRTAPIDRRTLSSPRALSDLDHNEITNLGLAAFAVPSRLLTDLKVLSLNDNRFDEGGIGRLVVLAPPLKTLERLLLDLTWVSDAGCDQLARAINGGWMPALRELSVSGSSTQVGQLALQEALLRSLVSRPQPVAKVLHARMELVLFLTRKLKLKLLRRA